MKNVFKSDQIWPNLTESDQIWSNLMKTSDEIWSNLIKSDQFPKYTHFGGVFGGPKKQPFLSVYSAHGVYVDHTPGLVVAPTGGGYAHG